MEHCRHHRWRYAHGLGGLLRTEPCEITQADDFLMTRAEAIECSADCRLLGTEQDGVCWIWRIGQRYSLESLLSALTPTGFAELVGDLVGSNSVQPRGQSGIGDVNGGDIAPCSFENQGRDVVGKMNVATASNDERPHSVYIPVVEHAKRLVVVLSTGHERTVTLVVIGEHRYTVWRIGAKYPVVGAVQRGDTVPITLEVVDDDGQWVHRSVVRWGVASGSCLTASSGPRLSER